MPDDFSYFAIMTALQNILFLDIETVSQFPDYQLLPSEWQMLWDRKAENLIKYHEGHTAESLYHRSGIYAEFGKIICISCGILSGSENKKLIIKSFCGDDERDILQRFSDMVRPWSSSGEKYLCAHNGKEFDFPYLCRRMIINNIPLPSILNISGKKPWEVNHLDTMELWKFGDYKSYTALSLLAHVLNIPTPKDDIDGSKVGEVYWKEKNLQRIVTYCQKDVITLTKVYLRLTGGGDNQDLNIEIKE